MLRLPVRPGRSEGYPRWVKRESTHFVRFTNQAARLYLFASPGTRWRCLKDTDQWHFWTLKKGEDGHSGIGPRRETREDSTPVAPPAHQRHTRDTRWAWHSAEVWEASPASPILAGQTQSNGALHHWERVHTGALPWTREAVPTAKTPAQAQRAEIRRATSHLKSSLRQAPRC